MKLIDKDAVVAEVKRRIKRFREEKDSVSIVKTNTYKGILSFLNSLEVKEVDLEKEINNELERTWYGEYLNTDKFKKSAIYFYELGLKAKQNNDSNRKNI